MNHSSPPASCRGAWSAWVIEGSSEHALTCSALWLDYLICLPPKDVQMMYRSSACNLFWHPPTTSEQYFTLQQRASLCVNGPLNRPMPYWHFLRTSDTDIAIFQDVGYKMNRFHTMTSKPPYWDFWSNALFTTVMEVIYVKQIKG